MNAVSALVRGLVVGYRCLISPVLPMACRYRPTCSEYALEAVARFGAVKGVWLASKRLFRCHPWGGHGYDPVPNEALGACAGRPEIDRVRTKPCGTDGPATV